MGDGRPFSRAVLEVWREEQEVHVETSAYSGAPAHRTVIWIVVDEAGRALVRSYRGPNARWYVEATATGTGAIVARGVRTPVSFVRADDPERVEACSTELDRKYAASRYATAMLADGVLATTLELRPVST